MEFFANTKIKFMRLGPTTLAISAVAVLLSLGYLFFGNALNIGIDFAGGTQLTVKFQESPDIDQIRGALAASDLDQSVIQRFGSEEDREVMIKVPVIGDNEEGRRADVEASLVQLYNSGASGFDLNTQGTEALASTLYQNDPEGMRPSDDEIGVRDHYREVAAAVMKVKLDQGVIGDVSEVTSLEGLDPSIGAFLQQNTYAGGFSIVQADNVGPQIGEELRRKGFLAVMASLIGMLIYIWWRFEFRFGVGALVALFHDVTICLGAYALGGYEFNLTTIAALLTVVGYSVNDSVVVFDRVRENLRRNRRQPLFDVLNESLNQTLSRTFLTSGTTLIAVGTLFFLGGEVIRGLTFVLVIGVIVGTYSSIFIASPIVLLWDRFFGRDATARRKGVTATAKA